MTDLAAPTRLGRLAGRAGMTEGQLYTVLIVFGLAALLLPSLRSLNTVAAALPDPLAAPAPADPGTPEPVDEADEPAPASTPSSAPIALPPTTPVAPPPTPIAPAPAQPSPPAPAPSEPAPTEAPSSPPVAAGTLDLVLEDLGPIGGVVVLLDGSVVVATSGTPDALAQLRHLERDGTLRHRAVIGGNPREAVLGGVELDVDGTVLLVEEQASRVYRYDPNTTRVDQVAVLRDVPTCGLTQTTGCQSALQDTPPAASDVAVLDDGTILVSDTGQAMVWRIPPDGDPEPWFADLTVTRIDGLDVREDGGVLVITRGLELLPQLSRSSLVLVTDAAGQAVGTPQGAGSAVGDYWGDLQVRADGTLAVTSSAGTVILLDPAGVETGTVDRVGNHALEAPAALDEVDGRLVVGDDTSAGGRIVEEAGA